jgi:hypothetical protein
MKKTRSRNSRGTDPLKHFLQTLNASAKKLYIFKHFEKSIKLFFCQYLSLHYITLRRCNAAGLNGAVRELTTHGDGN